MTRMRTSIVLSLGAEAVLEKKDFFGTPCVYKTRLPKSYRHATLDSRIRRERTRREASLLSAAKKRGIRVPLVRHVNLADSVLVLEYIDAPTAKIALSKKNAWICPALG
ncbi:MAG: hypothetical protein Q7R47_04995, partial [Candidatus Diapherotrites archaeon]|nr:hypothetical protein [Candidatus Diapherotrites archaeon]